MVTVSTDDQQGAAGGPPGGGGGAMPAGPTANGAGAPAPQQGQDYSQQWIQYFRSQGMHSEAEKIEAQSKAGKVSSSFSLPPSFLRTRFARLVAHLSFGGCVDARTQLFSEYCMFSARDSKSE